MIGLMDFAGRWALSRRIEDVMAGEHGTFEGDAMFRPDGDALAYHEAGSLCLAGRPAIKATRRYLWRQEGTQIAVFFDKGGVFHRFDPGCERPEARHACPPDSYRVRYDFSDWPVWRSRWHVSGPRKGYVMETCYTPAARAETDQTNR